MPEREKMDLWALSDLCTPWCLHVVATLRVASHIDAGKSKIDALAAAANADCDSLYRVMRHLAGKGLFEEAVPGEFALNEISRGLLDASAQFFDLFGIGGRMAYAWGSLLNAVRTGKPAYHELFGRDFWDDLHANPQIAESFDAMMGPLGHGVPDPEVLLDGNWESIRTVVDVGGGTGSLLAEILRAHPTVRGILVEQPPTVGRARETFRAAGVADRVTAISQSFFEGLPAGADLYILKSVLADWPDREATSVLHRCAEAATVAHPVGRVVVHGGISPDEAGAPPPSLLMMVLVGGRERSVAEFRELARGAGLQVHAAGRLASGRFVVECRPTPGT